MEKIEEIVQMACSICGITTECMHTTRTRLSTDAKMLVARYLSDLGYQHGTIAKYVSRSRVTITSELKKYDDRVRFDKEFRMLHDKFRSEILKQIV